MELGNMVFGNSRGEYPMPRGVGYEEELERLFKKIDPKYFREVEFENETFSVFPYYWGDCTCGFDDYGFGEPHGEQCYQTELDAALARWDEENGYSYIEKILWGTSSLMPGFEAKETRVEPGMTLLEFRPRRDEVMERWHELRRKRYKFGDELYKQLTKKYGLPMQGCAVHCTCDFDERYARWLVSIGYPEGHKSDCLLVKPNFLYKPSGYSLKWYKYPLRDSYANRKMTLPEFKEMIDECIKSVQRTKRYATQHER